MKVDIVEDKIIVYIKKTTIKDVNFDSIDELETYFRALLLKLKNIYNININGFYNIKVFIDDVYGMVLDIEKERVDCYLDINQVEMRILPIHTCFLYKIEDLFKYKKTKIYEYKNNYYLKPDKKILYKDYLNLLENSKIVYNNTDNIIKYGLKINNFNFNKIML